MSEVQTSQHSGEMARRFIEFVLMHSQNAAFFLGQVPNPQTSKPEVNLDMARLFIDQLEMIREKTKGNLTKEESEILDNSLTNLRLAFVSTKNKTDAPPAATPAPEQQTENTPPSESAQPLNETAPQTSEPPADSESKKRFTKSYGA